MMKKILVLWLVISLVILTVIMVTMETSLPIFTYIWLLVPLFLLFKKEVNYMGVRKITFKKVLKYSFLHFISIGIIYLIFEPWSKTYKLLIDFAVKSQPPDPTFIWLTFYDGFISYLLMFTITIFITIFGEELFFRGLLFNYFKEKIDVFLAIVLQAAIFAVPNLILALMMPGLQGFIYIFIYAFLAIGCVGGYTAYKTNSIWPSLISASSMNLILVLIYF